MIKTIVLFVLCYIGRSNGFAKLSMKLLRETRTSSKQTISTIHSLPSSPPISLHQYCSNQISRSMMKNTCSTLLIGYLSSEFIYPKFAKAFDNNNNGGVLFNTTTSAAMAMATTDTDTTTTATTVKSERAQYYSKSDITHKVYMNIKIANYTEESRGTNQAASGSGRIVFGLFGKSAPRAVNIFLKTCKSNGEDEYPSYINTQLSRVNEYGLLEVTKLKGLELVSLAGSDQYEYRGKVVTDFIPSVESNTFKHTIRGLLSRSQLSGGPEFGITTIPNPSLDQYHEVFGVILDGFDVLDAIEAIPRYTYTTKTGYASSKKGGEGAIADLWFENQKKFYVGVGKSLGDRRAVDQRGKLLRRVQIKDCGVL